MGGGICKCYILSGNLQYGVMICVYMNTFPSFLSFDVEDCTSHCRE